MTQRLATYLDFATLSCGDSLSGTNVLTANKIMVGDKLERINKVTSRQPRSECIKCKFKWKQTEVTSGRWPIWRRILLCNTFISIL